MKRAFQAPQGPAESTLTITTPAPSSAACSLDQHQQEGGQGHNMTHHMTCHMTYLHLQLHLEHLADASNASKVHLPTTNILVVGTTTNSQYSKDICTNKC